MIAFVDLAGVDVCRTCIFNTPLYKGGQSGEGDLLDYVDCPCCVLDVYPGSVAINEDGPRCELAIIFMHEKKKTLNWKL